MSGIALSRFGLSVDAFFDTTPREFHIALRDHAETIQLQSQFDQELAFESARFIAFHVWNSAGKVLKRPFDRMEQVFPFPWDKESPQRKQSPDEMKGILMGIAFHQNARIDKREKRKSNRKK